MDRKVRMEDIAERMGVSTVSVYKALSGKSGVSNTLRARIMECAEQMGYVTLRNKPETKPEHKTKNIGVVMPEHFFDINSFYSGLYRQVVKCCSELGYTALLELIPREAEENCILPVIVQRRNVDGILFLGQISVEYIHAIANYGQPYLLLDFYDDRIDADSITSDNISGGYRLTSYLLQTGRTKIGFLGTQSATSSIMDRFLGYTKALLQANIPISSEWILKDRNEYGELITLELPENMPEAFVCSCDKVAVDLVELLKSKGYRVPEDVAVAGYDDNILAQMCSPKLTTYRVNVEAMGSLAVSRLIRRIDGKRLASGMTSPKGELILREST